jgi:RNA polymerase sigma factor, sigma-70 family
VDEALIISNIKNGKLESFTAIVELYERRVYGFLLRMVHDNNEAKDLTQDVFLKVYTGMYRFDERLPLKPWIFKIAYNTAVNYMKKNKSFVPLEEDMKIEVNTFGDIEIKNIVRDEINRFEPGAKAILLLKIMEDLSFDQIAAVLNTTPSAVKMKYYRNRKVLMERLSCILEER